MTFSKSLLSAFAIIFLSTSMIGLPAQSQTPHSPLTELPSGQYDVDLSHSSVIWKVTHLGLSGYVGRFEDFDASIDLNTQDISKSSLSVTIKTDSVDTAYPRPETVDFNAKVAEKILSSVDFATIEFQSTSVSSLDGNKLTVEGNLTMAGQTNPVTLDATLNGAILKRPFTGLPIVGFSATTSFNRSDWGVDAYIPGASDQVTVNIEAEFMLNNSQ